jgi:hypothetical protein
MAGKQIVSAAPGGGGIEWETLKGKLLVVEPLEVEHMVTQFSKGVEQECVRANVYVVLAKDGSKSEAHEDTLIFPRVLIGQTKRKIGQYVVGRLGQGTAKAGQDPPWTMAEASDGDLKAATAFLNAQAVTSASTTDDGDDFADEGDDSF